MPNTTKKSATKSGRGGSHEKHVEAGKQSHKNSVSKAGTSSDRTSKSK